METKVCNTCKVEFPANDDNFHKQKGGKYGFNSKCKKCNIKNSKKWKENNPEKARELSRNWGLINSNKIKESYKKWKENNPERVRELSRNWAAKNPERSKNWAAKNPEIMQISSLKARLKKQIGFEPPKELIEVKFLIIKTAKLCKTLNN